MLNLSEGIRHQWLQFRSLIIKKFKLLKSKILGFQPQENLYHTPQGIRIKRLRCSSSGQNQMVLHSYQMFKAPSSVLVQLESRASLRMYLMIQLRKGFRFDPSPFLLPQTFLGSGRHASSLLIALVIPCPTQLLFNNCKITTHINVKIQKWSPRVVFQGNSQSFMARQTLGQDEHSGLVPYQDKSPDPAKRESTGRKTIFTYRKQLEEPGMRPGSYYSFRRSHFGSLP